MSINCINCLDDSDHPFRLILEEDGVCRACRQATESSVNVNLNALFESPCSSNYDCIVVLNGTPEDYFIIKKLIENKKYPLLYYVNNYFCNELAWKNIHQLMEKYDLELRTYSPDLRIYKKLVGHSFRKYEDVLLPHKMIRFYKSFELATELGVNIILTGEMQTMHTVGKFQLKDMVENTKWNFETHELLGTVSEEVWDTGIDINRDELKAIIPMHSYNRNIKWKYLSNYTDWDQWKQDCEMVAEEGAFACWNNGSFDMSYRAGNSVYYEIQDLLRHKKFKHYKLRDHLSREIRKCRITKDNATKLYNEYASQKKFYVDPFFQWLGVSEAGIKWIKYNVLSDYEFVSEETRHSIVWPSFFDKYLDLKFESAEQYHIPMYKGY